MFEPADDRTDVDRVRPGRESDAPSEDLFALPVETVLSRLDVNADIGLASAEAEERLRRFGPNALDDSGRRTAAIDILLRQFASPIVWLLIAAAAVSSMIGDWMETAAIGVVIAINTAIGFGTEIRAVRSMEALRRLGGRTARLLRDGDVRAVSAEALVPGDIVLLEAGDAVPADLRIVRSANLAADESTLTGESAPVDKEVDPVEQTAALADRASMLYRGAAVTRGAATAVVAATGPRTEIGRISKLVETASGDQSPLERGLTRLSQRLLWATLAFAALIAIVGVVGGRDIALMMEAGIALAVAAIPEGLPIVATLVLARGMLRMARQNALVERLSAVETLGATTVILTDKTGTLTENRMSVDLARTSAGTFEFSTERGLLRDGAPITLSDAPTVRDVLISGALCTNATLASDTGEATGDPTEVALLRAASCAGIDISALAHAQPKLVEDPFESATKRMATTHRTPDGDVTVFVKGAPEAVLPLCVSYRTDGRDATLPDAAKEEWLSHAESAAADGFRMLALASKSAANPSAIGETYENLVFLGLVALRDPPRQDVRASIEACHRAGVDVVMVTGDHIATARNIADAVGLADLSSPALAGREVGDRIEVGDAKTLARVSVFARVSPEQKLDLIQLHQRRGEVVAMTGDGVNDAPALRQADIGIAMGKRGTQVAKDAADVVLTDDAFSTIATAIRQGRIIFANIRRFVIYLLSCNLSEIMIVGGAILAGLPLPLLPLQILFLNLVTDVFPAFALGLDEGDDNVLARPPRDPKENILARRHWLLVIAYGTAITTAVLAAMTIARATLSLPPAEVVTISFLTLALAQIWHVFAMRDLKQPPWRNTVVRNRYIWMAIGLCLILIGAAVFVPVLALPLALVEPSAEGWMLALSASVAPLLIVELASFVLRRRLVA